MYMCLHHLPSRARAAVGSCCCCVVGGTLSTRGRAQKCKNWSPVPLSCLCVSVCVHCTAPFQPRRTFPTESTLQSLLVFEIYKSCWTWIQECDQYGLSKKGRPDATLDLVVPLPLHQADFADLLILCTSAPLHFIAVFNTVYCLLKH